VIFEPTYKPEPINIAAAATINLFYTAIDKQPRILSPYDNQV